MGMGRLMSETNTFLSGTGHQQNVRPGFLGDFLNREHLLPGGAKIDAAAFNGAEAVKVTVTANRAVDATEVAVTALSAAIPSGTVLDFGGKKFARLTAEAAKGVTSLVVAALATALVTSDVAYYNPPGEKKRVPAGTPVGLTNTELEGAANAGIAWGPAGDADDVVRLTAFDVVDANTNNDVDLLRPGTLIKVNRLPNWSSLSAAVKTKIRATYECTVGAPGQEVAIRNNRFISQSAF